MKRSREERSLEERVLDLEISNLYQSLTTRLIEIYDEQKRKPEQRSTSDESFDVNEAARRLGVRTGLVRKQVRERRLRHHRIGRLLRFSQQDIEDFISAQKTDIRGTTPRTSKKRSATRQVGEAARGNSYGASNKLAPQQKNPKGGDQKGSKQGREATEVSIARRLKELSEEMREW